MTTFEHQSIGTVSELLLEKLNDLRALSPAHVLLGFYNLVLQGELLQSSQFHEMFSNIILDLEGSEYEALVTLLNACENTVDDLLKEGSHRTPVVCETLQTA